VHSAAFADIDRESSEVTMRVQRAGNGGVEAGKLIGWVNWAGRHPGIVLLGALVTVILSSRMSPRDREFADEDGARDDEVPLFI